MRFRNFPYILKEGVRSLWVNRLMSFASIGVLCVCLLLISNAVLLSFNISSMIQNMGSGNVIVVYLREDMSEEEAIAFESKLSAIDNVADIEFTSSRQALEIWKEKLADYSELMDAIEPDYLPASYSITVKDIDKLDTTRYLLQEMDEITEINENKDVAVQLKNLKNMITTTLMTVVLILFIVSMFIIVNTIKLAMYSRRKEINIMKYVGGTDWFIRWPFIVEGFLIGIISGLVAFGIQWYIYEIVITRTLSAFSFIDIIPFGNLSVMLAVAMCAVGAVIGMIGSTLSIRKYLKV